MKTNTDRKEGRDEKFYDQVASELQNKILKPGLWTRAYAEANGDDAKARALYIKYRVQQLRWEAQMQIEREKKERRATERAAMPKLSPITKFANLLFGLFFGFLAVCLVFLTIGLMFDQSDTSYTVADKIATFIGCSLIASAFVLIAYKSLKAL